MSEMEANSAGWSCRYDTSVRPPLSVSAGASPPRHTTRLPLSSGRAPRRTLPSAGAERTALREEEGRTVEAAQDEGSGGAPAGGLSGGGACPWMSTIESECRFATGSFAT